MKKAGGFIERLRSTGDAYQAKTTSVLLLTILKSARITPSNDVSVQLVRSLIVSTIAFVVDFGLMVFLKEVGGLHYIIAATISYCCGLVVNYCLSVKWVFAHRKLANQHAEFAVFAVISLVGLGINIVVLSGLVQLLDVDYKLAKVIATVVVFFWNFLARKKILY